MTAWTPLESNPDVLNNLIKAWDVSGPFEFVDVYGLDPELLAMIPQPVLAVLLLYPVSVIEGEGTVNTESSLKEFPGEVFYTKQTIQNACGSIAVLHSIANNVGLLNLQDGGAFAQYFLKAKQKSPQERAKLLETDTAMKNGHESCGSEGQTEAPAAEDDVDLHFVCFVHKDGRLVELDGRKKGPIDHGPSSPDTLLNDAAEVVKEFTRKNPSVLQFNLMALASM